MPLSKKIKVRKKPVKAKPNADHKDKIPDVILEQTEKPMTTTHSPESISANGLKNVTRHPENYIEINIINKNRMVDNFYINITHEKFRYKTKKYEVDEKKIYLLPSKSGFFMLTSFYMENDPKPKSFEKTNKGITSKALSLLYNDRLYNDLFAPDESKYNFIIAVMLIVNTFIYLGGLYINHRGGF